MAATEFETTPKRWLVADVLRHYAFVLSEGGHNLGRTTLAEHEIPLKSGIRPITQPPYQMGPEKKAEVERQILDLRCKGKVEPTRGAWSSPVVLVRSKDGSWLFFIDYQLLNEVSEADTYPLPCIDERFDALSGSQYFSTLDLASGDWCLECQVPLNPEAQENVAFVTQGGL